MGQKVNPIGLRLGINRTWDSRWYAGKNEYATLLHEDMKIRKELMTSLKQAAVSKIVIERPHKKCRVTIHSARPGVVIGKKGADIEKLRKVVAEAYVGKALVLKRFHPRGRGRMGKILKPFSNLTIVVRQVQSEAA